MLSHGSNHSSSSSTGQPRMKPAAAAGRLLQRVRLSAAAVYLLVGAALLACLAFKPPHAGPQHHMAAHEHAACFSSSSTPGSSVVEAAHVPPTEWVRGAGVAPLAAAGSSPHERFLARIRDLGFAPSHILDVGANEGHWAQMVAGVFNASAPNILCVEGSQHRAEALRQKQATFAISVVGATPGLVHWYDASNAGMAHTGNSVLRENTRFFSGVKPVRVPVRTLDQVVADYEQLAGSRVVPGLVKVDVQGFELEVLKGAPAVLSRADVVLLETSVLPYNRGAPQTAEVVTFMHCLGFMVLDVTETHYVGSTLFQIDFAFVRKTSPLLHAAYAAEKAWLQLGQQS